MYQNFSDFYWGEGLAEPKQRLAGSKAETTSTNQWTKRHQRMEEITEYYRKQNERLRKPCPCCGTLVKPELLKQHYEAYHPALPTALAV